MWLVLVLFDLLTLIRLLFDYLVWGVVWWFRLIAAGWLVGYCFDLVFCGFVVCFLGGCLHWFVVCGWVAICGFVVFVLLWFGCLVAFWLLV